MRFLSSSLSSVGQSFESDRESRDAPAAAGVRFDESQVRRLPLPWPRLAALRAERSTVGRSRRDAPTARTNRRCSRPSVAPARAPKPKRGSARARPNRHATYGSALHLAPARGELASGLRVCCRLPAEEPRDSRLPDGSCSSRAAPETCMSRPGGATRFYWQLVMQKTGSRDAMDR